jgi:adsorption protein B
MFGYLMLANLVAIELFTRYTGSGQVPDYGLLATPPMMTLLVANLLFLIWRVGHRVLFTTMIYDWHHGLMAGPRLIVASVLNFFASARAINIYLAHRLLRRPLRWDKTRHAYPFQLGLEVLAAAQTTPPGE